MLHLIQSSVYFFLIGGICRKEIAELIYRKAKLSEDRQIRFAKDKVKQIENDFFFI